RAVLLEVKRGYVAESVLRRRQGAEARALVADREAAVARPRGPDREAHGRDGGKLQLKRNPAALVGDEQLFENPGRAVGGGLGQSGLQFPPVPEPAGGDAGEESL